LIDIRLLYCRQTATATSYNDLHKVGIGIIVPFRRY